jgi:hypothetical protein
MLITRPTHNAAFFLQENHFWINKSILNFEKTTLAANRTLRSCKPLTTIETTMTFIHGQVESLAKVKTSLESQSIHRFKSIREINEFTRNYQTELQAISAKVETDFCEEVKALMKEESERSEHYIFVKKLRENELNAKLQKLRSKITKNYGGSLWTWFLKLRVQWLEGNYHRRIEKQVQTEREKLYSVQEKVQRLKLAQDSIIDQRCSVAQTELRRIKSIVDELAPTIAGAIGESMVNKELQKLSDEYILINNYSRSFDPPIYNRKEKDRIFSVQIDHLLISRAGIFVIETKNWSKKSLQNFSLRSPVEQIRRTSFALFVLLNGNKSSPEKIGLKSHHWGERTIPIRNLIVMINHKPRQTFKHVQVKLLNELIGYVEYFEPIMSKEEVYSVYEYLKMDE